MKKHLFQIVLFLAGISLFTSCLKDDPDNNATVYYGYQQIPNINDYMPQSLLYAMGENNLYFGDEPPKLEGAYIAESITKMNVICVPGSTWIHQHSPNAAIDGTRLFNFTEQHKGISRLHYYFDNVGTPIEESWTDSTQYVMRRLLDQFVEDSISPVYFKNEENDLDDVLEYVYIMGDDPYFTIYYYDVRRPRGYGVDFEPLYANIISGRLDKDLVVVSDTINNTTDTIVRPVIKNFRWGVEVVAYYKDLDRLNALLNLPTSVYPRKGDIMIMKNATDIPQIDNPE